MGTEARGNLAQWPWPNLAYLTALHVSAKAGFIDVAMPSPILDITKKARQAVVLCHVVHWLVKVLEGCDPRATDQLLVITQGLALSLQSELI